jgi:hypothetical protein
MLHADEGMWTFDNLPLKPLKDKYNFIPTPQWLDHVRLSSVRLSDGGSGSFVSPHGLLMTNHHVARAQLQNNSTAQHDYLRNGFYAATEGEEMKTPNLEVNILVSMENVTSRVLASMQKGESDQEALKARKAVVAGIERESMNGTGLRSDVVSLYQGGEYWLYRYKKYTDVRLVFAPEQQIAFFGGDPDNFTYPRYDLDMAIYRVYENGKPIDSTNYLKWNAKGAGDHELVFVSGNPGRTERLNTLAQLLYQRDEAQPRILELLKNRIQALKDYSARGPEQARQAGSMIFSLENSQKSFRGSHQALLDPQIVAKKQQEENDFRALVKSHPDWEAKYGGAWDAIAASCQKLMSRQDQQMFRALDSQLFQYALQIVRYVAEVKKPDGERLAQFHDAQLESLRYRLFAKTPVYPELEEARLSASLALDLRKLGPDDPYLKAVLDGRTPGDAAKQLVGGTKMADPALRKSLIEGGPAAVDASTDPMIVVARNVDPLSREMIKWQEDNVQSVVTRAGEELGKARFMAFGKSTYPDATFTLRLSYGTVKGYPMNGTVAPPKTTFYGLYDRAASFNFDGPWALPSRYTEGREKLNLSTPFDFVTDNDIVGGNSGSPVINRDGEVVGLIFDGNIESLAGDYVYNEENNRSVAVHTAAMTEALRKLYGAGKLADELEGVNR